jgi:hypothetical protein
LERSLSKARTKKASLERVISEVQAENKIYESNNSALKVSLEEAIKNTELVRDSVVSETIGLKDVEIEQLRMEISTFEAHLEHLNGANEALTHTVEVIKAEKIDLSKHIEELSSDKGDASSSSNKMDARQKIKIQMQVKKELEASSSIIDQLTRERDAALSELTSIKKVSQAEIFFPDKLGQVNISMRKRKAMGDANSNVTADEQPSFNEKMLDWKENRSAGGASQSASSDMQLKEAFSNM